MKAFNINHIIKVKLTNHAKDIYYHQHDKLNKSYGRELIKPSYPEVDKDGFTEFQLWHFIEIYGPYMHMTSPMILQDNNIYISEENLRDVEG